ncbi:Uncharacterized protein PECH_008261 [Penicillium ucsense]|uniref:Probable E3 ubiquitin ligase complex SCF subunit sconB n=1 Tax=Penicillium ucsense TaxID=2839758 RepID=A0A8J8WN55_9EURO|nr:Uncharacterized protein PECM_007499 [Penicillium ucsense]KAF7734316.1 Uncharacterized protein PECH_008261 [Penicillium ucsense]
MPKRHLDDALVTQPPSKRRDLKSTPPDRLSSLSDELLLQILSFLPISSLNICQRLSRRFHTLAGDPELWKRQYYVQWVRPRARRLANVTRSTLPSKISAARVDYSPKVSTWLDHGHLTEDGKITNWKGQYRLRHNWSTGVCRVSEVKFTESQTPPLAQLCAGVVFTADTVHGLRAWAAKDPAHCFAEISFSDSVETPSINPTALTVSHFVDEREVVVGFEDGQACRYLFNVRTARLQLVSRHTGLADGAITAMALSSPYLMIVSENENLSLYNFQGSARSSKSAKLQKLTSLSAANMVAPMTLSMRRSGVNIVATIVYSFFHISCGWSLGIQELRFDRTGQQVESRLTSTVESQHGTFSERGRPESRTRRDSVGLDIDVDRIAPDSGEPLIVHLHPPTSISYSHPYLLTSHADNTLTMYLVVSDNQRLFVRGGQRLWGHTSSVSAVQVTNRGKAISVSGRGDEIRIWELEPAVRSLGSRPLLQDENSIKVHPEHPDRDEADLDSAPTGSPGDIAEEHEVPDGWSIIQGCVGFDEERVLLLREKAVGTQLLECYDFT